MKAKPHSANSFLQLLAHRERGRMRLIAWSLRKSSDQLGARWNLFHEPAKPGLMPQKPPQRHRSGCQL